MTNTRPQITTECCEYELVEEKKIASGSFGSVFKVRKKNDSKGEIFALKKVNKKNKDIPEEFRSIFIQESRKESLMAQTFDHPNVIRAIESWETENSICTVFPLAHCDLTSIIDVFRDINRNSKSKMHIPESILRMVIIDVAKALNYLKTVHRVAHLDIKPDNIFLMETKGNYSSYKFVVGDFGLSMKVPLPPNETVQLNVVVATISHRPPENFGILGHPKGFSKIGRLETDIWSFGMIIFELLFTHLYYGLTKEKAEEKVMNIIENMFMGSNEKGTISTETKNSISINYIKSIISNMHVLGMDVKKAPFFTLDISKDFSDLMSNILQLNPRDRIDPIGIINSKYIMDARGGPLPDHCYMTHLVKKVKK